MFLGLHHFSLDDERRLMVSTRFYEMLSGGGFITQGFDRNIMVLTTEAFQDIYQLITSLNLADPQARLLIRMILGTASQLEMDESGHIIVPQNLREFAGIENVGVLVGQGDYFEIWAPQMWKKQVADLQNVEVNSQRFASLDLARR